MDSGEIMVALLVVLGFFWMDVGGSDQKNPVQLCRDWRLSVTRLEVRTSEIDISPHNIYLQTCMLYLAYQAC